MHAMATHGSQSTTLEIRPLLLPCECLELAQFARLCSVPFTRVAVLPTTSGRAFFHTAPLCTSLWQEVTASGNEGLEASSLSL